MKTKIVYVLTSDESDFYLEQTLMSVYSLRLHNPDANVSLVTDEYTRNTCNEGLRKEFLEYFDEIVQVNTSEFKTKGERSRLLKTTLREHITGDYLYIDGDTIVCESLSDIDKQTGALAFALDIHLRNKEDWPLMFDKQSLQMGFGTADVSKHFNSGVSFVKDVPETHLFYKRWNEEWRANLKKTGSKQDQPPLHNVFHKYGVHVDELDGIWNCQIAANFMPYLHKAKILHTFTSGTWIDSPCMFKDMSLCREIRENGGLTERIVSLIHSPKEAFYSVNIVLGREGVAMAKSKLTTRAKYFRQNYPPLYGMLDFVSKILMTACVVLNRFKGIK